MRHASAEPDSRQQLCRAALRRFLRSPGDSEWHHHILESRKFAKQVMKLEDEPNSAVSQLSKLHLVPPVNRLTSNYNIATRRFVERAENVQIVPIAADVRLVDVVCVEYGHRHSCLIASIGKSLDACTDGYTVATAAIAMLARTIHITSTGCVDTGK